MNRIIAFALAATASLLFAAGSSFAQGSLTPTNSPGPMMKTLDQIEARTPIDAIHTPGDSTSLYIINKPGSYYLTGNVIGVTGEEGITIQANNVTLDLNGFALTANVFNSKEAVFVNGPYYNVVVRNGRISGWAQTGVSASSAFNGRFEQLTVNGCGIYGIGAGQNCSVINCNVNSNNSDGIVVGDGSTVRGCSSNGSNNNGIQAGANCVVSECISSGNGNDGIDAGNFSILTDCIANANMNNAGFNVGLGVTLKSCTAGNNGIGTHGIGIQGGIRCTYLNCTASYNHGYGIYISGDSTVMNCRSSNNSAGIISNGSGSRIEGNQARDNGGIGIFSNADDIVIRNGSGGNSGANYSPASGANFGPIQSPATATNPMANIQF